MSVWFVCDLLFAAWWARQAACNKEPSRFQYAMAALIICMFFVSIAARDYVQ